MWEKQAWARAPAGKQRRRGAGAARTEDLATLNDGRKLSR
jgi:hypothetical protein